MTGHALAAGCAALVFGCSSKSPYACTSADQCVLAGMSGVCEPQGFCSFADTSCASGRKFEPNAGNGLASTCVTGDAGIDAPIDGPPPAACIAGVGFGRHFGCVLGTDHTVHCVGENDHGQLGIGIAGNPSLTYVEVLDDTTGTAITDATAIGLGGSHACAVRAGGELWCWGWNGNGQVGNNTTTDAPAAVPVQRTDGSRLANITAIAAGAIHTCALDTAGTVWCFGTNGNGELGDGTTTQRSQAANVLVAAAGAPLANVAELAAGHRHTCIRNASNEIWCWGQNGSGQLGDGSTTNRASPVNPTSAAHVAAGAYAHTCAVAADGTALCWGSPWHSRLGNGQDNSAPAVTRPSQVLSVLGGGPMTGAAQIAVGGSSCVVDQGGTVRCWGDNVHGQTGTGNGEVVPAQVTYSDGTPLRSVDALVAHYAHVCAHHSDGLFECWGRDLDGELGDGSSAQRGFPQVLGYPCP